MTDSPRVLRLGSSSDELDALADALKDAAAADVVIVMEPDRPVSTPEVQLLLAAAADPAGPSSLRIASASPRVAAGLRLLGLEGRIEVAA